MRKFLCAVLGHVVDARGFRDAGMMGVYLVGTCRHCGRRFYRDT